MQANEPAKLKLIETEVQSFKVVGKEEPLKYDDDKVVHNSLYTTIRWRLIAVTRPGLS